MPSCRKEDLLHKGTGWELPLIQASLMVVLQANPIIVKQGSIRRIMVHTAWDLAGASCTFLMIDRSLLWNNGFCFPASSLQKNIVTGLYEVVSCINTPKPTKKKETFFNFRIRDARQILLATFVVVKEIAPGSIHNSGRIVLLFFYVCLFLIVGIAPLFAIQKSMGVSWTISLMSLLIVLFPAHSWLPTPITCRSSTWVLDSSIRMFSFVGQTSVLKVQSFEETPGLFWLIHRIISRNVKLQRSQPHVILYM